MEEEKRNGHSPVPPNYRNALSPDQMMTLRQIENFGWEVAFVRRPSLTEKVIVVSSADHNKLGVLENDGQLNLEPGLKFREHAQ